MADLRAEEVAVSFSHIRPDGSSWSTALPERTYYFTGENLFTTTDASTPEEIASLCINTWLDSEDERDKLFNPYYMVTAVGVVASDDGLYVVQEFGTPVF